MKLNTLSFQAVEAPDGRRNVVRKVSVGQVGVDAEIQWQFKTALSEWEPAKDEVDSKAKALAVLLVPSMETHKPTRLKP